MALHNLGMQKPYWEDALSELVKGTGEAATKLIGQHVQKGQEKKAEAKEKEKKEAQRQQQAQAMSAFGMPYEQAYAYLGAPPEWQKDFIERGGLGQLRFGANAGQRPGMETGGGMGSQMPISNLQGLAQPQKEQLPYGAMTMGGMAQGQSMTDPGAFLTQRVMQGAAGGSNPMQGPSQAQQGMQPQMRPKDQQKPLSPERQMKQEVSELVRSYDIDHGIDMSPDNVSDMMRMGMTKADASASLKEAHEWSESLSEKVSAAKGLKPIMNRMIGLVQNDELSGGKLLRGPGAHTILESLEHGHGKLGASGLSAAIGGILGGLVGTFIVPGLGTAAGASAGTALGGAAGGIASTGAEAFLKSTATKETQEFEKLSAEFIKGAKGIFGGRVTNQDLDAFLKMVPTLKNTNEGKMVILRNLQRVNDASILEGQIRDQIKKMNGGALPYNIREMVEDISSTILDREAEKFKKDTEILMKIFSNKS